MTAEEIRKKQSEQFAEASRKMFECSFQAGFDKGATDQQEIDIELIPQLFIRWLMIDGDKPNWKDYVKQTIEK